MKTTRQGVRDLDAQYGKVKKKRQEEPPVAINCTHRWDCIDKMGAIFKCHHCGLVIDHVGNELPSY